jgi:hypothetical protein
MAATEHTHEEMWRAPASVSRGDDEDVHEDSPARTTEERAVVDSWYEVLRRKHVEEAGDDEV